MGFPHEKRPWWGRHLCTITHGFHLWTRHSFLVSDTVTIDLTTRGDIEFSYFFPLIVFYLGLWPSLLHASLCVTSVFHISACFPYSLSFLIYMCVHPSPVFYVRAHVLRTYDSSAGTRRSDR